jgi:predicted MFS family arabinose efflux permease
MKASRPRVLGQRASFWVSAGVVTHIFWTSAAPAMTYRLYAEQWHLTPTVTTGIFAVYPIIVVAVLVGFGDLSDHIGRRLVMLLGLGASLIGTLLFAVAPGVLWLFAGRALTGIGVGLTAGTATAALVDFSTEGQSQRAASVTPAAQAFGFTGALLLGGALTQYAPWPTHLGFWLLFALIALLFAATWFLPRRPGGPAGGPASSRWRPKSPAIPAGLGSTFALSASAVTTAYTHGVLILSVGGQVGHDLVGSSNALVNGAALSLFAITSGMVGISARGLRPRWAMLCGAIASVASMGLLALSVARQGLPIFLAATTIAGIGYSLLVLGGLALLGGAVQERQRGGVLSALYLFAYLSLGIVALGLGVVATERGLGLAVDLGAAAITALSLGTIGLLALQRMHVRQVPAAPFCGEGCGQSA